MTTGAATFGSSTRQNRRREKALVFRNEDNGWYFKFDSGDIAAEASKLAKNEVEETALLKYYGLRIAILDSYPNVLSLKEVESDYVYVPWVNMVILVLLLILCSSGPASKSAACSAQQRPS